MQKVSEEVLICMCFRDAKILIKQETFAWLEMHISQTLAKPVIVQHYCSSIFGIDEKTPISVL